MQKWFVPPDGRTGSEGDDKAHNPAHSEHHIGIAIKLEHACLIVTLFLWLLSKAAARPRGLQPAVAWSYLGSFQLLVLFAYLGGLVVLPGCASPPPPPPAEHVKINVSMPRDPDGEVEVIVNNRSIGSANGAKGSQLTFPPMPNGNNSVEFLHKSSKITSGKREFFATSGAEINITVFYWIKHGGLFGRTERGCDVDFSVLKQGEPPSIDGATLETDPIRREAHREVVTGQPGTKFTLSRKRTIERQITLSESARVELVAGAKLGFGLLEVTASIKTTLAQKDTALIRDKEEITQSVEVPFDRDGTATIVWVDHIKRGKARYKFNSTVKELEFEITYSSELTVSRKN